MQHFGVLHMGIAHFFKIDGDELRRGDAGCCKLLLELSELINGWMRLMYISRLAMGFVASFFVQGISVPYLQLRYN